MAEIGKPTREEPLVVPAPPTTVPREEPSPQVTPPVHVPVEEPVPV